MKKTFNYILGLVLVFSLFSACKKDDDNAANPNPTNEEELITTLRIYLTDSAQISLPAWYDYKDLDGDGGMDPVSDTIRLEAGKTYYANIILLDESKNPADSISNEILEEANDHLFVFEPHDAFFSVEITDRDTNSTALPIGLQSKWRTFQGGETHLHISLKHQPGIKTGDPDIGETDLEAKFVVEIK